jgi:hypothetical protein
MPRTRRKKRKKRKTRRKEEKRKMTTLRSRRVGSDMRSGIVRTTVEVKGRTVTAILIRFQTLKTTLW